MVAAGSRVPDLEPGTRVVCEANIPCNACRRCRAGEPQLCERYDQVGFTRGGGLGEYVVVPERVVHRLPEHVSFETAVLVEPASVVLSGMQRARPEPAQTIGVIGIGTLGSLAIRLARLFSPVTIVAYGIRPDELEFARALGADHVVSVLDDPEAATMRLVDGGLDVVLETAGAVEAVEPRRGSPGKEGGSSPTGSRPPTSRSSSPPIAS